MRFGQSYAIGDKVWIAHQSKAVQIEISKIIVTSQGVSYMDNTFVRVPEEHAFPTKKALILYMVN